MRIQSSIETKLTQQFSPTFLSVVNESANHNVPANSETHFKLIVVSELFDSLSRVKRQQLIYKSLSDELAGEVHALSMQTFTAAEWQQSPLMQESPQCMGGSKTDN